MKILIVDDHEIVTYGVKKYILEHHPEYDVTATVNPAFLDEIFLDIPDLVILDVEYPDSNVFDIIARLRKEWTACAIIIYTIHEEAGLLRRLFDAGVDNIALKSASVSTLLSSIESIARGEHPELNSKITSIIKHTPDTPRLTAAEKTVLNLIRQGLSSCEMASQLNVSENTIESHRRHLLRKLEARNVAELIVKAQKAGW